MKTRVKRQDDRSARFSSPPLPCPPASGRAKARGPVGKIGRGTCSLLVFWLLLLPLPAQELLLREVVSREFSLHVEAGSEEKEVISRELSIHVENGSEQGETISRELSLVISDEAVPPPLSEVAVVTSPTGDQVDLDWTSYNPWQYGDIAEFRIYLSDTGPITDVSALTPALIVGGENTTASLTGLTEFTDHFLAIVAVDAGGRFEPLVQYAAAYVLSPEVISREVSLFIGQEPASPYREVISRELSLAITPSTPPPAVTEFTVATSPQGDSATLDWSSYNQWANAPVDHFAIYLSDTAAFSDVSGLTPFALVPGGQTGVTLEGLASGTDHFFAVVPVDSLGQFEPAVNYGAAYVLSPQVVSRELSLFIGQEPTSPYREVVSREFDVLVPDAATPAPVTGVDSGFLVETSTSDFGAVRLDFSAYNESAQLDVIGYDVYVGDTFFDDVTSLTPFARLPAGDLTPTLTGLPGGVVRHFAVVAVDALGGFDPAVRSYSALTSIDAVGEVLNLAGTGNDTTLSFTWEAPEEVGSFLQGYRVTLGNREPVDLPAGTLSFEASDLLPATGYPFRISTINHLGEASAGTSLNAATWLPNPEGTLLTLIDGEVYLTWNAASPQALVSHYEVYRSSTPFTEITSLTPLATTTGLQAAVGDLASVQDQYFAVVTVNSLGTSDPNVTSLWAAKQAQTISFSPISAGSNLIPLNATASSGLPVRFEASPSQTAQIEGGNALRVLQGGLVQVDALQDGDDTYWAAQESQSLRLPPLITSLTSQGIEIADGITITQESEIAVTARDVDGIEKAEFFGRVPTGNWSLLATDQIPNDGFTTYLPVDTLPTGDYELRTVVTTPSGYASERSHAVILEFLPTLAMNLDSVLTEGDSLSGQVTIGRARSSDLSLTLATSRPSRLSVASPVTIPAGSTFANFTVSAPQDYALGDAIEVRVTASSPGSEAASALVTVLDDDTPVLTLSADRTVLSEADGSQAVTVQLQRDPVLPGALTVALENSDSSVLSAPATVTIPAGQASVNFPLDALDNDIADGTKTTGLQAKVFLGDTLASSSNLLTFEVGDDEGPALELTMDPKWVKEGESAVATLSRTGTDTSSALLVNFSASPEDELNFPATATIPAGASEVSLTVYGVEDGEVDGNQSVALNASAANHNPAQLNLVVTDLDLADLVTSQTSAPEEVDTDSYFQVGYQLSNSGNAPASGFLQRVYLSSDRVVGDDLLLNQYTFASELAPGVGFSRSESIRAPREAGTYWLIVTADAVNAVDEIIETNNTVIHAQPIEVTAAYTATVEAAESLYTANTPIALTGSAWKNGEKEPYVMVNIHLRVDGTERIFSAITDSTGNFATTWQPLPNEGGNYEIGATHPGTPEAATQDAFTILTLATDFPDVAITLDESSAASFTGTIENSSSQTMTGLAIEAVDAPDGLTFSYTLPSSTLNPSDAITVGIVASAAEGTYGDETVTFRITTDEGLVLEVPVDFEIRQLLPKLVATPTPLSASVVRGTQRVVSFQLQNQGSAESGPINLLLPTLSWLSPASGSTLPSIESGESAQVSLLLAPGIAEDLTLFQGNMILQPTHGSELNLPFSLRVVSDLTSDLEVFVVDEYYFFTEEKPKVEGASVVVRDAITAEEIHRLETGADGIARCPDLLEGWYSIEVDSPDHSRFQGNFFVDAGETNWEQIFLPRELVSYNWTVEEVEIADRYQITVETTFETNVPAPVVTVTPAVIDVADLVSVGESKTVNLTLENHGLIASQQGRFEFGSHPYYQFTPLISDIGTLPAKSSITVPVTVSRIGTAAPSAKSKGAKSGGTPCAVSSCYVHGYWCGDLFVTRCESIATSGVEGDCGGGNWHPTGGGGSGSVTYSPVSVQSSPTNCLNECWLKIIFELVWKLADPPNWAKCGKSAAGAAANPSIGGAAWAAFRCACAFKGLIKHPLVQAAAGPICDRSKYIKCFLDLVDCINTQFGGGGGGSNPGGAKSARGAKNATPDAIHLLDQQTIDFFENEVDADFAEAMRRTAAVIDYYAYLYGSVETFYVLSSEAGHSFNESFLVASWEDSEEGHRISATELAELEQIVADEEMDEVMISEFLERWKNTLDLSDQGILNHADAPAAMQQRFIATDILRERADLMTAAIAASEADGYLDPFNEQWARASELAENLGVGGGGVCARVKLRIDQDAVMTRSAFKATLELSNNLDDIPLTAVGFDLDIRDVADQPADDVFNVQVTDLEGLDAVDGSGFLAASTTGTAEWTLIPRDTAAPLADTVYTIGGTITYNQGGTLFTVPIEAVQITVRPDAALYLKYFHQRDVFSDDPHTDPIEASIPYSLAVLVENQGSGEARDLSITSAQPEIVENEKGLLIDFQIIGTEVAGQNLSPSLTANFGDIPAGESAVGTWLMTSSLQGLFIDYEATFEHLDGFGDERLSLIKEVEIHEMNHLIEALGDKSDGLPDFLVNDIADINDYPDTVHYSDGGTAPVTVVEEATVGTVGGGNLTVTLNASFGPGWTYLRVPDPADGQFRLISATRSDGLVIPVDRNVWVTDRTFIGLGRRPIYENILHLVDCDSTGQYTLTYEAVGADTTPPQSAVAALPAQSNAFIPVSWTGSDDDAVAYFDLFVSIDGGEWTPWLSRTTRTSAVYEGTVGSSYAFYSQATDLTGNVEIQEALADTSTEVTLVNQAPVMTAIPNASIDEGETFYLTVNATDPDGDSGALQYAVASNREGLVIDPTGRIRWNTGESDGGSTATVTVTVRDSGYPTGATSEVFTISVNDINSPPTLPPIAGQTVDAGDSLSLVVLANDIDEPAQTVAFSLVTAPEGMSLEPDSGVLAWTPESEQAGESHLVEIRATDSGSPPQSSTMSFAVLVPEDIDLPPVFSPVTPLLWFSGESESTAVFASDPDNDLVTISANLSALGAEASFTGPEGSGQGILSWAIPQDTAAQVVQVPLTARSNGLATTLNLEIRVEEQDLYWEWAREALAGVADISDYDKEANPDGDLLNNLAEMAFLTNPLLPDAPGVLLTNYDREGPFGRVDLRIYRRKGSEDLVRFVPQSSPSLDGDWQTVSPFDWSAEVDLRGDDDGRPESESLDFSIFEFFPDEIPTRYFFRFEAQETVETP